MKVLNAKQTKQAEQLAARMGMSGERLMENAGSAAARVIRKSFDLANEKIVIVTGQGNNAGDGFVVARKLKEYGAKVTVVMAMGITVTADSALMLGRARQAQVPMLYYYDDAELGANLLDSATLLVDAIFGTGFHGVPDREISAIIERMNRSGAKRVALDLPSGVCCDTGEVHGAAVKADLTVSFIGYKPCHFLFPATDFCGKTVAVPIGIDADRITDFLADSVEPERALSLLSDIPRDAHKGTKGTAMMIAGSYGMAGAAALSAKAAMRSGAGLVRLCLPESIYPCLAGALPEVVFRPLRERDGFLSAESIAPTLFKNIDSLLIGPGLGACDATAGAVARALSCAAVPTVIDADGLNIIADDLSLLRQAKNRVIITPHPGEMARLCGKTVREIQQDRIGTAVRFANEWDVITVLKGAYTVIAEPEGRVFINTTGNAGMATAGSGDMLAGMIAAFLANGTEPVSAAVAGVCLHGAAGDAAAAQLGTRGMMTGDMIEQLPAIFKHRFGG